MRIGLVFDLLGTHPGGPDCPPDADAEYEPEDTVLALEAAIHALGHDPVRLGKPERLLALAGERQVPPLDAALNIAEGHGSRNREAWAPVLLEMLGVPTLGSDALTLSVSLDKAWTKALVRAAGIPTPDYAVVESVRDLDSKEIPVPWPLFVKPRWEGTAKGIGPSSRVEDRGALAAQVDRIVEAYRQPALVEVFLDGPEYTVTVVGNDPPRALPVLQRALEAQTRIGLHAVEHPDHELDHCLPGELSAELEAELGALAVGAFRALDCRDFARVDFRIDRHGSASFLEINPLPSFAASGSFGVLAELAGVSHAALLGEVIQRGLARLGLS